MCLLGYLQFVFLIGESVTHSIYLTQKKKKKKIYEWQVVQLFQHNKLLLSILEKSMSVS